MAMAPDAQGAPPAQEQPQDGGAAGGGVGKLIEGINSGLSQLMEIFVKSPGVPDQFKQKLDALGQGFSQLIQEMSQGPEEGEEPAQGKPEASGAVPMEAGANKNVQPAY